MLLFLFQLSDAENSYQKLLKNKANLEQDIEIKAISLLIDKEECLANRQTLHLISMATGTILWMY